MKQNLFALGEEIDLFTEELIEEPQANLDKVMKIPKLVEAAESFKKLPLTTVSHGKEHKVVCVLQREYAIVRTSVVDFVGGDDFTNTILVFIRLGDFVACGHFDQTEVVIGEPDCGVLRMVEELEEAAALAEGDESQLHCWIVGGFMDENKHSSAILGLILASLNHCSRVCDIRLACSERLNQSADAPRPVVVGAAFSSAQGTVIPAHWTHLGPAVGMRTALACSGPETLSRVYDWKRDCLVVHFQYAALSAAADLLQLTDDQLRDACSTSSYETDRFAKTLRAGLTFLYQHPDHKEVFADGPVEFSRNEQLGAWMLVKKKQ